jgi:hypothetical protein
VRALVVLGAVSAGLAFSGAAAAWNLRGADGAIYFRLEFPGNRMAFRCVRPRNGFWIRFTSVFGNLRISTRMARRFRGIPDRRAYRVALGRGWTSSDARGISRVLQCWRARDGRELALAPGGAYADMRPKAQGFGPSGFRLLPPRAVFTWRCPRVADGRCQSRQGSVVFSCRNNGSRLTCRNLSWRGFWITARDFRTL